MTKKSETAIDTCKAADLIVIRPFEHDDCEKIMQVDWSNKVENCYEWQNGSLVLVKEEPVYIGPDYTKEEKLDQIQRVEKELRDPEAITIGAFHDGTLIGYTCINTFEHPETEEKWHCLWQMVVSNSYRRRGIAGRMFEAARDRALENGGENICLSATISEEAVAFYLSVGFEPAQKPSWWKPDGIYMVMQL